MIMKKFIYLLMLVGVVSLMLGCPGASDPLAPVSGPPASESSESAKSGLPTESDPAAKSSGLPKSGPPKSIEPEEDPLSLTAQIEWTGYRSTVVRITANKDISDVGVILSDNAKLAKTDSLMAEKVYYKRKLTADTKILVHLGLLNGFTLKTYNPNPSVIKTGVDPETLRIPQPGKTYYVYVFSPGHNKKLPVTTEALITGAPVAMAPLHAQISRLGALSYRLGELHIFPMILRMSGVRGHRFIFSRDEGEDITMFQQDIEDDGALEGSDIPGYIFYEYSTSSANTFRDSAIFRVMKHNDLTQMLGTVYLNDDTGYLAYNLELNQ